MPKINLKDYYSLDLNDGIEYHALADCDTPEDIYEQKMNREIIVKAFIALSEIQQKRIYTHYILKLSQTEIARLEGVSLVAVNISIRKGLKKYLEENL